MNTPTLAHVALVKGLQTAAYDFAVAESGQLTDASDRLCTARDAILNTLAQPALAAPVLPVSETEARQRACRQGYEQGWHDRACGSKHAYLNDAAPLPTPAASPEQAQEGLKGFLAAAKAAGITALDLRHLYDEPTAPSLQPVEASPSDEVNMDTRYANTEFRDGDGKLLAVVVAGKHQARMVSALQGAKVKVAAPVAPTEPTDERAKFIAWLAGRIHPAGAPHFGVAERTAEIEWDDGLPGVMAASAWRAALSAAKPEPLSDAQIEREHAEYMARDERRLTGLSAFQSIWRHAEAILKLQAGGEA